jgi:hypothetical protein
MVKADRLQAQTIARVMALVGHRPPAPAVSSAPAPAASDVSSTAASPPNATSGAN